jgi:hypothetical protein
MSSMISIIRAAVGRRSARRQLPGTLAVLAVLSLGLGVAACDGDNLFSGGGRGVGQGPPLVTSITVPDRIGEGQQLDIRLRAVAPQGLTLVTVRFRRAVVAERTFEVATRTDTVTLDFSLQIPAEVPDTVLVIEAFATDQFGRVSEIASRTVNVFDTSAPSVTVTSAATSASPGGTLDLRVVARDAGGLQSFGYVILSANGDTIARRVVATSGTQRDTTFSINVPFSVRDAEVSVVAFAINASNLVGQSAPLVLAVSDNTPPSLTFLEPREGGSYTQGSPLRVRLHVRDSASGLAEVRIRGVAFRNFPDTLSNATPVVRYPEIIVPFPQGPDRPPPVDTVIVRDLQPNADRTSEPIHIIAEVRDRAGNLTVDTVRVVPGPRVTIISPPADGVARINSVMQIRVEAIDPDAGLDSVKVHITGVVNDVIVRRNLGGMRTLYELESTVQTGPQAGTMEVTAFAWNTAGGRGQTQPVRITISEQAVLDTVPPQVRRRVESAPRVELGDAVRVVVQANDGAGSGIRRMGVVMVATPAGGISPRVIAQSSDDFVPPRSGSVEQTFHVTLGEQFGETDLTLPLAMTLQVHAYAVDGDGNCSVAIADEPSTRVCADSVFSGGRWHYYAAATPAGLSVTTVAGRSVQLPGGGRIADAVVDPVRRRIYLSNMDRNRVEAFYLASNSFEQRGGLLGRVGAAPWGMVVSNNGDSLYVANSGGTNLSVLWLGDRTTGPTSPGGLVEDVSRRILTPNARLLNLSWELGEGGILRYNKGAVLDFSDRPQFVAQHATGTLLYSTLPTAAAANGTIRYVDSSVSGRPEVYIMHRGAVTNTNDAIALAGVDSLTIVRAVEESDLVILFSRRPGTSTVVQSPPLPIEEALAYLRANGAVQVDHFAGEWDRAAITLGDTTFVAASGNRQVIAFGEGAVSPYGRILLCCTITPGPPLRLGFTSETNVGDLVQNAAERVHGLDLNADGSLGVARGARSAYYFTGSDGASLGAGALRLQGEFREGVSGGTGGAALHPNLAGVLSADPNVRLSFVATADRSIKIVDTVHFYERGEIHLRDNVVGPVRAFLPSAEDNSGIAASDPRFIVVKLLAVTAGENVVIVNVRRRDIQN